MIASVMATMVVSRGVKVNELPIRIMDVRNDVVNYVRGVLSIH